MQALGSADAGELCIGGVPAAHIAAEYGTPIYAFDARQIERRVRAVRAALGDRVGLLWSVKANPSVAITTLLREAGCGAEVASLGELAVARAAGHATEHLRFAGPAKTDQDLEVAIRGRVCLHVESPGELRAISCLAERLATEAQVALRVNLPAGMTGARLRMGGTNSRFGIDRDQIPALVQELLAMPTITFRGLHVYGGTQCFDAEAFAAQAGSLCQLADQIEDQYGHQVRELDLGGGFGVPTFCGDQEFDLEAAGAAVRELLNVHDRPHRHFYVELGRFLTAPAGVYLSRVVRSKKSGHTTQIALDGGMHQAAIGTGLGSLMRRPPMLVHATALDAPATATMTVGGPLCTPQDQFGADIRMPAVAEGDLLAVLGMGAYGLTFSPSRFLSHAEPAEVLVQNGEMRVIRARGLPEDALRNQQA